MTMGEALLVRVAEGTCLSRANPPGGAALSSTRWRSPEPSGGAAAPSAATGCQASLLPLAPEYNMGGFLRRNELNAFVSQSARVNPLEQSLSPAQQDQRDSNVQLIDEARTKIFLDSVRSAANAHIHSVGRVARPVKRLVNTCKSPNTGAEI